MKKASAYRQHVEERRALAQGMQGDKRDQLIEMTATWFGLLRALIPLQVPPMSLGKSAEAMAGEPALIASFGGSSMIAPVHIAAKREFAGS